MGDKDYPLRQHGPLHRCSPALRGAHQQPPGGSMKIKLPMAEPLSGKGQASVPRQLVKSCHFDKEMEAG